MAEGDTVTVIRKRIGKGICPTQWKMILICHQKYKCILIDIKSFEYVSVQNMYVICGRINM